MTARADVDLAAKRITNNKFWNAGQACLSANHVFVDPSIHDAFVDRVQYWISHHSTPEFLHTQMSHIVNQKHYERISSILTATSGTIVTGGLGFQDPSSSLPSFKTTFIPPTLITNVSLSDSTMSTENFGPLLPIVKLSWRAACDHLSSQPLPLGLYIFSDSQREIDQILNATNSGGVTVNDVMMHPAIPTAPFGGVGESGMGAYHGRYSVEAFSHRRTVLHVPGWLDYLIGFRYPPWGDEKVKKLPVVKNPGFKRGEGMEDQVRRGRGWWSGSIVGLSSRVLVKWIAIASVLAIVDARFGGESKMIGLLKSAKGKLMW